MISESWVPRGISKTSPTRGISIVSSAVSLALVSVSQWGPRRFSSTRFRSDAGQTRSALTVTARWRASSRALISVRLGACRPVASCWSSSARYSATYASTALAILQVENDDLVNDDQLQSRESAEEHLGVVPLFVVGNEVVQPDPMAHHPDLAVGAPVQTVGQPLNERFGTFRRSSPGLESCRSLTASAARASARRRSCGACPRRGIRSGGPVPW